MSSILQELEKEIANVTASVEKSNVGVVREVGDGVAKVEGLSDVMLNEMISFPGGVTGLAMNLEEGEVGVVLLGSYDKIVAGMNEVAEGIKTTMAVKQLADRAGLEMPITNEVKAVLYDGKSVGAAVAELMSRPLREEV